MIYPFRRVRRQTVATVALILAVAGPALWIWANLPDHANIAGPLVISQGGTYSGTWKSKNARVPAVTIQTSDPVIIENATIRGRGNLIQTNVTHAQITIRNTHGIGLNPRVRGLSPGRFLTAESFDSIDVENCQLDHTAGIYLLTYGGDFAPSHTIHILRNVATNIDGRKSTGSGGYTTQKIPAQFVQLDQVRHVPGIEIAWNQVTNAPRHSGVEDVISIYKSSGTQTSPIRIHDNFIDGAYPADPRSREYSGGGIMLGDGSADSVDAACGYVEAYANQVLNTTNYGIAISAGHDIVFHDNRILSTGRLPDGSPVSAQNVGAYIWDTNRNARRTPPTFFNNSAHDNLIGWQKGRERNDWWTPDAASWTNNAHWPAPLSAHLLESEEQAWKQKLFASRITPGVAAH